MKRGMRRARLRPVLLQPKFMYLFLLVISMLLLLHLGLHGLLFSWVSCTVHRSCIYRYTNSDVHDIVLIDS